MLAIQVPYCATESLVEPELFEEHGPWPGRVVGAQDGPGWGPGEEMDEEEGEDGDEEADDDQLDETAGDEPEHGKGGAQSLRHIGVG